MTKGGFRNNAVNIQQLYVEGLPYDTTRRRDEAIKYTVELNSCLGSTEMIPGKETRFQNFKTHFALGLH